MHFNSWQIKHKKVYDSVADFEHAMENFQGTNHSPLTHQTSNANPDFCLTHPQPL
jgi:hypothetical protein